MISEKYSLAEKSVGGYIIGIIVLGGALPCFYIFPFGSLVIILIGIVSIYKQSAFNRAVPENNILFKYIKYIEQVHSEIPEKYHEAILSNLRNCHSSSFGGFDETKTFSTDELDQHINDFMKDADQNLKEYAKMQMNVPK